jgi:hypothetical protein
MKKKITLMILALVAVVLNTGCIQEKTVIPVSVITGKIVVPEGKVATGVKVRVAGEGTYAFANEKGVYEIEMRKEGRFLLMARGVDFDINYVWVDTELEKTVSAPDIKLNSKIVGEAIWMANLIDYPDAKEFSVKSINPVWGTQVEKMYDDGTHGDSLSGDGIYTLRKNNLVSGYQQYKIVAGGKESNDPNSEQTLNGNSTLYIPESALKTVTGYITSAASTNVYASVKVATNKGARSAFLNSAGQYNFAVQGNGTEYLVFRSHNFDVKAIPIDLSKVTTLDNGPTQIEAKVAKRVKMICIKSEFSDAVGSPVVMGDFNNWRQDQMFDDGTYGDEVANDGIYTRVYDNVTYTGSSTLKYHFCVNGTDTVRDPYEEGNDGTYSTVTMQF